MRHALRADRIFDGWRIHHHHALILQGAQVVGVVKTVPDDVPLTELGAGILVPGFLDLQVNGGGGEMIGPETDPEQLARICATHCTLGATSILPTLISDTAEVTAQVIRAAQQAHAARVPGLAGLHLEGPHLDRTRAGAHDPGVIRPMTDRDLRQLKMAARELRALMVTLAPGAASCAQISQLHAAGVVVSLGHSDCTAAQAKAAFSAGAHCVTHLFNAMSQLENRAPGLVGTALCSHGHAGIIADGVHVAEEATCIALSMTAPDRLFLVSDAMATAGSDISSFELNGRTVFRGDGRLTLADGTLAGADISLPQSIAYLVGLGVCPERALAMASRIPADVIGASHLGRFTQGAQADMVLLNDAFGVERVFVAGQPFDRPRA